MIQDTTAIEEFGNGYIVADYSGNRGRQGAAYAGVDGIWQDQPMGIDPFPTKLAAQIWADAAPDAPAR